MKCAKCPNETAKDYRKHCPKCETELLNQGLCQQCGTKPRKPKYRGNIQSYYCEECQQATQEASKPYFPRKERTAYD